MATQSTDSTGFLPVRDRVTKAEWDARVELAALYRLLDHMRWTDSIYTHISMRVPNEEAFLINPFGMLYSEVIASSLVKIDIEGRILDDPVGLGINTAGFVIHSAVHGHRHEVACVIHTHTRAGAGVAAQEHGLLPISQHAAVLFEHVRYHDFEGVALDLGERERLVADLGDRNLLILRNHGLLAVGRSAGEAFFFLNGLERACEIQIAALAGGSEVRRISAEAMQACGRVMAAQTDFSRDWAPMLRLVDRIAPDYRS